MINKIPEIEIPKWLLGETFQFCLNDVLTNSLYYPSCGMDGIPIQYFMGNIYSFIYVDYGIDEKEFIMEINKPNAFKGYELIKIEKISKYQLDNGQKINYLPRLSEQEPSKNWIKNPYCYWTIFERDIYYSDTHNPKRFSLLYLCSEAVSAYYALYNQNNIAPKILSIIQDGFGFGGNWTNYTDRKLDLAWAVFSNNKLPEYLINGGYGGNYEDSIWPEYTKKIFHKYFPKSKKYSYPRKSFTSPETISELMALLYDEISELKALLYEDYFYSPKSFTLWERNFNEESPDQRSGGYAKISP
jgi:hypothetical protein